MSMLIEVLPLHHYENPSEYFYHLDKFFELLFAIFHRFHMQKLSCNLQRKMFSNPFIGIVIVFLMKNMLVSSNSWSPTYLSWFWTENFKNIWHSQTCSPTAHTGLYAELLLLQFPQSPNTLCSFNVKQTIIPENTCIINWFYNFLIFLSWLWNFSFKVYVSMC